MNATDANISGPYLDKGYVHLLRWLGSDRTIAEAAWVSADNGRERADFHVSRVIRYMARNGHWTPFGQTALTFRFRLPLFVANQLKRSNVGIVWNEESRRYVDSAPEFHIPVRWRKRSESMKQGSGEEFEPRLYYNPRSMIGEGGWESPTETLKRKYAADVELYGKMLEVGICPEQAREVLPVAMYTTIVGTFSLAALARVYKLRADQHAQEEIRELAGLIHKCVCHCGAFDAAWSALICGGG